MNIELKNVTKQYYYGPKVLACVDLKVESGEIVALVGNRGAGKTTLLKVIAGVEKPSIGRIFFDGDEKPLKNDDVQMIFDDLAIFKRKTVWYNIAYPLIVRGIPKQEIQQKVKEVAEKLEMQSMLDLRISELLPIDKKFIALARVLIRDCKVLICDEVCSDLPLEERTFFWNIFSKFLVESGKTVVFSTNDVKEAVSIANKIVVLNDGKIKQVGTVKEILNLPQNVWAIEQIDSTFSFDNAQIVEENSELKLKIDDETIIIEKLRNKILCDDYVGKNVLFGSKKDNFEIGVGKPKKIERYIGIENGNFLAILENGWKVEVENKFDDGFLKALPKVNNLFLFDKKSENSIMKGEE